MYLLTIKFVIFFMAIFLVKLLLEIVAKKINKRIDCVPVFLANFLFPLFFGLKSSLCFFSYLIIAFFLALIIEKTKHKKIFFVSGIILFAAFLIISKLLTFNFSFLKLIPNLEINISPILMPIGMSYYSLVSIAYIYDVYTNKIKAEHNFVKYFLFTGNFLKIFQGPIECYNKEKSTNIIKSEFLTYDNFSHSAQLILWGLFKKMVIADWLSVPVSSIFDAVERPCGSIIFFGAILFYIQLYYDFSGCMDIVTGYSEMLGIKIMKNFNHPFYATSVTDFWHRWHISLSSWLKNYIYIPLGGNRKGKLRTYVNIIIVFLVSGFWHGDGIKFFAWGLLPAFLQILERILKNRNCLSKKYKESKLAQIIVTFFFISLTWIFFRCSGLSRSIHFYKEIFTNFQFPLLIQNLYNLGLDKSQCFILCLSIILVFTIEFIQEFFNISIKEKIDSLPLVLRWIIYILFISVIVIFGHYGPQFEPGTFIYEQF